MTDLSQYLPSDLRCAVVLRRPLTTDVDAMLRYFESLGEASRGFFHPHPFDMEHAESICLDADPEVFKVVAESEGEIVGYAWYGPSNRSPYPMVGIGISDSFQGRRLGGALMDTLSAEARSRGLAGLRLTVYKENKRAVRLYTSRGYRVVGDEGRQHVMDLVFAPADEAGPKE